VLYVAATSGYCIHLNPFLFPVFVLLAFLFEVNSGLANTHAFNGPLSGTTQVSRYQKGKTNLDFTEARDSEWQWHQLGYVQVCTLLQTDNHASTHHSVFLQVGGGCLSCHPTKSVKALKAPQVQPSAMENFGSLSELAYESEIHLMNVCWRCCLVHFCTGDFLLELMQSLAGTKTMFDLLNFVINLLKYNAVYLKEDAVSGIIK